MIPENAFKAFSIRRLAKNDYYNYPRKQINFLLKKQGIKTYFYKQIKKDIQPTLIRNMENMLPIITRHFGEILEDNKNLYFVLASDNHENKNPLIFLILYNIIMVNDKGIIIEINSYYQIHKHHVFKIIKLCSTT